MSDIITVTGLVATTPRHIVTSEGLAITSFRLASTQRRFDRGAEKWVDGDTNWYTVTAFRQLASNVSASVKKGERILVTGRVRIRDWESGERAGTTVDLEADALGHDLGWGTASFSRSLTAARLAEAESAAGGSVEVADPESVESEVGEDAQVEPVAVPF